MKDLIIVDFESLGDPKALAKAKELVIEYMVSHPATIITVLSGNSAISVKDTRKTLLEYQFPCDVVTCNPLPEGTSQTEFKKMFAERFKVNAASDEVRLVLVLDSDVEARNIWASAGARFTFDPSSQNLEHT